ncbi:MAG: cysteine synthase family protein [Lachnoclostridium sp.]|nr:cysteine synthase family protein [Lachnospira sp.]MCM1247430.1 cysteine synthase family protein [Lachnoclostridium sp.]
MSILDYVGNTPLLELEGYEKQNDLKARIYGKLEFFNPTGSVKDRVAKQMILQAEKEGKLKPGDTIFENTSGNTGISMAALGAAKGYKVVIALEPGVSIERSQILHAYGAELMSFLDVPNVAEVMMSPNATFQSTLVPMGEYAASHGYFYTNQCANDANVQAHYETTAPEIWNQLEGKVDIFVAMCGTGGTITGVSRYLKEQNPDVKIVLALPDADSLPAPGKTTPKIDGILKLNGRSDPMAPIFFKKYGFNYDEEIIVSAKNAYKVAHEIAASDGLFIGESSAAVLVAAKELADRPENKGKNIVVLMADGGQKYLSSMFKEED